MMPEEFKPGCIRPALKKKEVEVVNEMQVINQKESDTMIKVGKPAPLFTAPAYYEGKFVNVSLEEYKGDWVVLCFYPGDFTFV